MEAGFVALIAVTAFVLGIMVGSFVKRTKKIPSDTQGILNVDCSDPDYPDLFLGLEVPVTDIVSRKRVVFDVNVTK